MVNGDVYCIVCGTMCQHLPNCNYVGMCSRAVKRSSHTIWITVIVVYNLQDFESKTYK